MSKSFDELLESVNVGDTVTGLLKADLKTTLHQELQKARQEEKLKHCCCLIEDSKVTERCKLHGDELQKAREEEVSNIIADYMEALGTVQLPQEVWLWIADINGKYLNKTLKENI